MDYRFLRAQGCSWIYLMEGSVRFGFMEKKFRLVWCSVQSTISCFDYKWWPDPSVMRTTANNPFNHSSSSLHLCKYLPFNFFHILALWLWIFRIRRRTHQGWPGVGLIGMNMTGQVELTKSEVLYFEKMTDNYRDELSKSQNDGVWIISVISQC